MQSPATSGTGHGTQSQASGCSGRDPRCVMLQIELCLLKRYVPLLTPVNVTSFRVRGFADVIKLRRGHNCMRVGPNPMTGVRIRRGKFGHRHIGYISCKGSCRRENAKRCQKPPGARREAWDRVSFRASRRNQSCQYFDFKLLASRVVR